MSAFLSRLSDLRFHPKASIAGAGFDRALDRGIQLVKAVYLLFFRLTHNGNIGKGRLSYSGIDIQLTNDPNMPCNAVKTPQYSRN